MGEDGVQLNSYTVFSEIIAGKEAEMGLRTEWPCWKIMECNPEAVEKCPAAHADKFCWEVMRATDPYSANICRDCLVHVVNQENSILSQEEILSIMSQKGVSTVSNADRGCPLCSQSSA